MSIYALNPPHHLRVSVRSIRGTRYPLLVIDELYRTPDLVLQHALALAYRRGPPGGHPGELAHVDLEEPMQALYDLVHRHIGAACGYVDTGAHAVEADRAQFFRLPPADRLHEVPHVDDTLLVGLVYINRPEHCRGGTAFFRHRRTGLAEFRLRPYRPVDPRVLEACRRMGVNEGYVAGARAHAWADHGELGEMLWGTEAVASQPPSRAWSVIDAVAMRHNRLVCYPGFVFHAPLYGPGSFGTAAAARRLTQNLFFAWPRADRSAAW